MTNSAAGHQHLELATNQVRSLATRSRCGISAVRGDGGAGNVALFDWLQVAGVKPYCARAVQLGAPGAWKVAEQRDAILRQPPASAAV